MINKLSFWKTLLCISVVLISGQTAFSQTYTDSITKKATDTLPLVKPKKLQFGCGFGLNFVGGTNISLSPNLTYSLNDKVALGAGIQGSYSGIKNFQNTTTVGANILGQYKPTKKIQTLLEFAQLRVSTKKDTEIDKSTRSYWDSALMVGAGYSITPKISVGAKYNLLYKEGESVYTSPIIPFVNISF